MKATTLEEAKLILNGIELINETKKEDVKTFPRIMWTWDKENDGSGRENAKKREVHGHIPTLKYPWIDHDGNASECASDDDDDSFGISLEEAEKLLGKKIKL